MRGCHEMATRSSAPSYQEIVTFIAVKLGPLIAVNFLTCAAIQVWSLD